MLVIGTSRDYLFSFNSHSQFPKSYMISIPFSLLGTLSAKFIHNRQNDSNEDLKNEEA